MNEFKRIVSLIGEDNFKKIQNKKVIIFGLGGVGGICIEALVRSGISYVGLVDKDVVDETNINRQVIAFHSTVSKNKVDVMEKMLLDINPKCFIQKYNMFYLPDNDNIDLKQYDYIIDCMDNVSAKVHLIIKAKENNIKIISSMGTGNKQDITKFKIASINQTSICPLAKVMRYELKKLKISDVKVLYSLEDSKKTNDNEISSMMTVVASAGLLIADWVLKDIINS